MVQGPENSALNYVCVCQLCHKLELTVFVLGHICLKVIAVSFE
jgi:hypothetical protein